MTRVDMRTLPNDAFVMLDPAVEMLEAEIAEHRFLCHDYFETGMAVPPGEGLIAFVTALMGKPMSVGALRGEFDDQQLLDKILTSLCLQGFAHMTSPTAPSREELAHLRNVAARTREKTLRRFLVFDLDVPASIEHLCAQFNAGETAPEVRFHCVRLPDHKRTLARLAHLRQGGAVRMHHAALQTTDLTSDREICQQLIRLGAEVLLEGISWPAPEKPICGLAEMTRHCVAVHALMTPNLSILDQTVRDRVVAWARSAYISGLCLRLEADALWPAAQPTDDSFIDVFNAVRLLENELGDVRIANLPSDGVLLGETVPCSSSNHLSDLANRFRKAYLRWRIPVLKSLEGDNTFSQVPEAEEKLVPLHEDLLPNHPELLVLRPGSVVVDVCGGLGRVARRLAPFVGQEGVIISIEMLRCVSDRARRFACEKKITNVQFRTGLAQRIALPDGVADAAVNEWTGGIWELGMGTAMVKEMARVVRRGGRIAVTHRLVQLSLTQLAHPWVQFEGIYRWMRDAFAQPELTIINEHIWGQVVPSLAGDNAIHWRKQYMPRLINPFDVTYECDADPTVRADVYLTMIAQRE